MFKDEIYPKAEVVLEEIVGLDKERQTQEEGNFYFTIELIIRLKSNLQDLIQIKNKNRPGQIEIEKENEFYRYKGYVLARDLGLAIFLFETNTSLKDSCFELLKVFAPFD